MSGNQGAGPEYFFSGRAQGRKNRGPARRKATRAVKKVGVIGAGTMGGGISMNFLSAGIPVTIVEMNQDALDRGTGVIRKNYDATAAKGKLNAAQVEQAVGLLNPTLDFQALADCDLIIEAVYETMEVKKEIFGRLDTIASRERSSPPTPATHVDEIAASPPAKEVFGMPFFSPPTLMKLLEVVSAPSRARALMTAMQLAKRISKVAVVAAFATDSSAPHAEQRKAKRTSCGRATPEQIDRSCRVRMPMGPFQMGRPRGVDIGWHRDPTGSESSDAPARRSWARRRRGFCDYAEKRRPSRHQVVQQIIRISLPRQGVQRREVSDRKSSSGD